MAKFTNNVDTGSLHVQTQELPEQFQQHGLKPQGLAIQLVGEAKPRPVTYIMGSKTKGFNLCCKGSGKFPTDGEYELVVD